MSGVISAVTYWMGKGSRRDFAGRYVKVHVNSVLHDRRPSIQAAANKAEPE